MRKKINKNHRRSICSIERRRFSCRAFVFGSLFSVFLSGCFVPMTQFNAANSERGVLAEQNRAQIAEINSLRERARDLEKKSVDSDSRIVLLKEEIDRREKLIADYQKSQEDLLVQYRRLASGETTVSPKTTQKLVELSKNYPALRYDAGLGACRLDVDVLFEGGDARLKPDAERTLRELARIVKSADGGDLRIVTVGRADDKRIGKKSARERYADNFQLSSARAAAVAESLREAGAPADRISAVGCGVEPSGASSEERQESRRAEVYVLGADSPWFSTSFSASSPRSAMR